MCRNLRLACATGFDQPGQRLATKTRAFRHINTSAPGTCGGPHAPICRSAFVMYTASKSSPPMVETSQLTPKDLHPSKRDKQLRM